jgi:hypothetical protein
VSDGGSGWGWPGPVREGEVCWDGVGCDGVVEGVGVVEEDMVFVMT